MEDKQGFLNGQGKAMVVKTDEPRRNTLLTTLKITAAAVAVCLIIGLTVALVITRMQLDEARDSKRVPERIEISDKTIKRVSDFISYGQEKLPELPEEDQSPHTVNKNK